LPSEDELYESYKKIAEKMEGKRVIIRTLDIGADKRLDYLDFEREENPALGFRGIRVCLERIDSP
jgi:phosphotransferase system enzyme I (PtsI)